MAQVLKTPTHDSEEYVEQSTASLQSAMTVVLLFLQTFHSKQIHTQFTLKEQSCNLTGEHYEKFTKMIEFNAMFLLLKYKNIICPLFKISIKKKIAPIFFMSIF